ncbi:Uncharacterized protein Adt_15861 [Abeliophyllum distichum]|uniref:Uncharacterized protein n=1 Tax=Abeliophyllum distichum TaxID=126358 RepID=A0ABD1U3M9_9LAMI
MDLKRPRSVRSSSKLKSDGIVIPSESQVSLVQKKRVPDFYSRTISSKLPVKEASVIETLNQMVKAQTEQPPKAAPDVLSQASGSKSSGPVSNTKEATVLIKMSKQVVEPHIGQTPTAVKWDGMGLVYGFRSFGFKKVETTNINNFGWCAFCKNRIDEGRNIHMYK